MKSVPSAPPIAAALFAGFLWGGGVPAAAILTGCASQAGSSVPDRALTRFEFDARKMGTEFRLVLYAPDQNAAQGAADAAFARIDELERELSDWRDDSEVASLRRACAERPAGPLAVSADLARVLAFAQSISAESDGAFDVTVAPLVELWRRAQRREELPDPAAIAQARARVGFERVGLDPAARTITFHAPGIRLDFGGIAKGDCADQVLALLARRGIPRALLAAGGDVTVGDPPPGAAAWRVELAPMADAPAPAAPCVLSLAQAAVSTSGDTYRFVEIDGTRYSHVVDPATGLGLTHRTLVSVVARRGIEADALATAASVLGPERGLALIARHPGAEARILALENGVLRACASAGLARMMLPSDDVDAGGRAPAPR